MHLEAKSPDALGGMTDKLFANAKDEKLVGVKYGDIKKNMESVRDYHIVSNLTSNQHAEGMSYDGKIKAGKKSKTIN